MFFFFYLLFVFLLKVYKEQSLNYLIYNKIIIKKKPNYFIKVYQDYIYNKLSKINMSSVPLRLILMN